MNLNTIQQNVVQDHHKLSVANLSKRCVQIKFGNNTSLCGWVHSVDPLTNSLILMKLIEKYSVLAVPDIIFIPGSNIKNLEFLENKLTTEIEAILDTIFQRKEASYGKGAIEKRRVALCTWLKDNRVPYTITNDMGVEVLHAAIILPPYTVESIQCKNEVVLDKVIKLVTTMPILQQDES